MEADEKIIKAIFTDYFTYLARKEHDKALDYLYPPLFKMISRKNLLSGMKKGIDKDVDTKLTELIMKSLSKETKIGNVRYRRLEYQFLMTMTFREKSGESVDDSEHENEMSKIDFTYEMFKPKYGVNNLTIDHNTKVLTARVNNQAYCICDPLYDGWKFLEKKDGTKELLEKLLRDA